MKITRFESANGPTWALQEGFCVIGYFKSEAEVMERAMMDFQRYRRKQLAELRPFIEGEPLEGVSVSGEDRKAGSPKAGDMIARNPANHADQWLVAKAYFEANFEPY